MFGFLCLLILKIAAASIHHCDGLWKAHYRRPIQWQQLPRRRIIVAAAAKSEGRVVSATKMEIPIRNPKEATIHPPLSLISPPIAIQVSTKPP
jgi:hypothetical protein